MAHDALEAKFKVILDGINRMLSADGFRKRGSSWRRMAEGNCTLVEIQRSQTSAGDTIRFTANVGVISRRLLAEEDADLDVSRVTSSHAHLRERLGAFLPVREDRWWALDDATEPKVVLAEVTPLLEQAAAFLHQHASDAQLARLWESGRSPGLTDFQRLRNLRTLGSRT